MRFLLLIRCEVTYGFNISGSGDVSMKVLDFLTLERKLRCIYYGFGLRRLNLTNLAKAMSMPRKVIPVKDASGTKKA